MFNELGNFSAIVQNFEMFLIQAEHRKHQLELLEEFNVVLDDLYVQVENFEWSESLETLKTLMSKMVAPE